MQFWISDFSTSWYLPVWTKNYLLTSFFDFLSNFTCSVLSDDNYKLKLGIKFDEDWVFVHQENLKLKKVKFYDR